MSKVLRWFSEVQIKCNSQQNTQLVDHHFGLISLDQYTSQFQFVSIFTVSMTHSLELNATGVKVQLTNITYSAFEII